MDRAWPSRWVSSSHDRALPSDSITFCGEKEFLTASAAPPTLAASASPAVRCNPGAAGAVGGTDEEAASNPSSSFAAQATVRGSGFLAGLETAAPERAEPLQEEPLGETLERGVSSFWLEDDELTPFSKRRRRILKGSSAASGSGILTSAAASGSWPAPPSALGVTSVLGDQRSVSSLGSMLNLASSSTGLPAASAEEFVG
mmetsp:Transcript_49924/g.128828  ORF Transcript_49924/g.128828 Transcript_49924/m.128828 type:complete len:201 (+) Transcript_49924:249-851(+)